MSNEATITLFMVFVTIAGVILDHRARAREANRLQNDKARDEARSARLVGQENQRHKFQVELQEQRYEQELKIQATERLTSWASRAVRALSRADHFLASDTDSTSERSKEIRLELGSELSSLVDEGRWLFPNHHPDAYGKDKAPLNRGFRDNRLGALVGMYQIILGDNGVEPHKCRKDFIFKVQELSIPLAEQVLQNRSTGHEKS